LFKSRNKDGTPPPPEPEAPSLTESPGDKLCLCNGICKTCTPAAVSIRLNNTIVLLLIDENACKGVVPDKLTVGVPETALSIVIYATSLLDNAMGELAKGMVYVFTVASLALDISKTTSFVNCNSVPVQVTTSSERRNELRSSICSIVEPLNKSVGFCVIDPCFYYFTHIFIALSLLRLPLV